MSGFKRTNSGLNNQHLFYNVDFVVYLEGGKTSYTKTEVYSGKYHEETEDIIFWTKVFKKFNEGKKLKFKSIGSKTTIKDISLDIINGQLKTVIVAMDNEFDELLNKRIAHPNVYYTRGYSFENDVWNASVIKGVIEALTAVEFETDEIELNFNDFLKKIQIAVYADYYMFKKAMSFFPRKAGYMFCIDCAPVDLPKVKQVDLSTKLTTVGLKRNTIQAFGRRHSVDVLKFCFGHLLADYCSQVIIHYIKKRHSLSNLSKDIINRMAINFFFNNCFNSGEVFEYHEKQFQRNILGVNENNRVI